MKENTRTAAIIGGLLLLATVIAVGVFVLSGSQGVSWFILIGIPVIVVAGIGLYVKGVTSQTGTTTKEYTESTGQSTAEEFQEFLREYHNINNSYNRFDPNLSSKINSIKGEFQSEGIEFDIETSSYELNDVDQASIQKFDKISNEISQANDLLQSNFNDFVDKQINSIDQSLVDLSEAELIRSAPSFYFEADSSLKEASTELDKARTEAQEVVEDATAAVREMGRGETRASDSEVIDEALSKANTAANRNEFQTAVNEILEAQDTLREQLSGSFESQYDEVDRLVSYFHDVEIRSYVDADTVSDLERSESTLEGLTDALDLAELSRVRSDIRRSCTDMIAQMQNEFEQNIKTLSQNDIPDDYYLNPEDIEDPVRELNQIDQLGRYSEVWKKTAQRLKKYNDELSTKAAVADAYPDVVGEIDEALQKEGTASADNIPMKNTSEFLELYSLKNESVEYDPERGVIHQGQIEAHQITVHVSFDDPPVTNQETTVELENSGHSATAIIKGDETSDIVFDEVPEGSHTILARANNDDYQVASRDIEVTEDDAYSIQLEERKLIDKVCEGVDVDVEEILSDIQTRLESKFDDHEYVASNMEFPVTGEYVPCLLATWGEKQGYEMCENNSEIIIYDHTEFENELEKIIRFNIESGESLSYNELKEKFISPPLPNDVIRDTIQDVESEKELSATESEIEVMN